MHVDMFFYDKIWSGRHLEESASNDGHVLIAIRTLGNGHLDLEIEDHGDECIAYVRTFVYYTRYVIYNYIYTCYICNHMYIYHT